METRNIQIDLNTARMWYKQGGQLKELALQAFSADELITQFPTSYSEYLKIVNPNEIWTTKVKCATATQATQFEVLCQLILIKDYYNQGWEPNWTDANENKYVISTHSNELSTFVSYFTNYIFAFKTRKLRDEFLSNFESQLESIKEFL